MMGDSASESQDDMGSTTAPPPARGVLRRPLNADPGWWHDRAGPAAAGTTFGGIETFTPTGPAVPTPSTSARLGGREPHVGRAVPGGLGQVVVADDR